MNGNNNSLSSRKPRIKILDNGNTRIRYMDSEIFISETQVTIDEDIHYLVSYVFLDALTLRISIFDARSEGFWVLQRLTSWEPRTPQRHIWEEFGPYLLSGESSMFYKHRRVSK